MRLSAITVLLALPGCILRNIFPEKEESDSFTLDVSVDGVQFDLPAGRVTVEVADVERVEVRRTLHYQGDAPTTSEDIAASTLFLKADCPVTNRVCSIDIAMKVPAGVWVAGETGAGDIEVTGQTSGVEVITGAGDILVDGAIGNVVLETDSGSIDGAALEANEAQAETGAGDVSLEIIGIVSAVYIDSGSGDIDLVVPSTTYNSTVATGAGHVTIEGITNDTNAFGSLYVHTGAGDITITGFTPAR